MCWWVLYLRIHHRLSCDRVAGSIEVELDHLWGSQAVSFDSKVSQNNSVMIKTNYYKSAAV